MNIGSLDKMIEIQRGTKTISASGAMSATTWETVARRWASISNITGNENYKSQRIVAEQTATIRLRFVNDVEIDSTYRIKYGEIIYNILAAVNDSEDGIELMLAVKRVN